MVGMLELDSNYCAHEKKDIHNRRAYRASLYGIGTQTIPILKISANSLILGQKGIYTCIDTFIELGYGVVTDKEARQALGIFIIKS